MLTAVSSLEIQSYTHKCKSYAEMCARVCMCVCVRACVSSSSYNGMEPLGEFSWKCPLALLSIFWKSLPCFLGHGRAKFLYFCQLSPRSRSTPALPSALPLPPAAAPATEDSPLPPPAPRLQPQCRPCVALVSFSPCLRSPPHCPLPAGTRQVAIPLRLGWLTMPGGQRQPDTQPMLTHSRS